MAFLAYTLKFDTGLLKSVALTPFLPLSLHFLSWSTTWLQIWCMESWFHISERNNLRICNMPWSSTISWLLQYVHGTISTKSGRSEVWKTPFQIFLHSQYFGCFKRMFGWHPGRRAATQAACSVDHTEAQTQRWTLLHSLLSKPADGRGGTSTTRQRKPRWGLGVAHARTKMNHLWIWHNTHNTRSLITVTVIVVIFCSGPKEWKWGWGER